MNRTGGDDLDDDFVPDDLVALSDPEDEGAAHSADGEDVGALLSADEDNAAPSTSQAALDKKRKRRAKEKERKAKVLSVVTVCMRNSLRCALCRSGSWLKTRVMSLRGP